MWKVKLPSIKMTFSGTVLDMTLEVNTKATTTMKSHSGVMSSIVTLGLFLL